MKQIDIREGARRQHRTISLFCVIQCWLKGADGMLLQRDVLQRLLGLEKFKQARVTWLEEDLKDFFPIQMPYLNPEGEPFRHLLISRIPFDQSPKIEILKIWNCPTAEQLSSLYEGVIPFFADYANYDERLLSSYLTLLAQGQIAPQDIPPLQE